MWYYKGHCDFSSMIVYTKWLRWGYHYKEFLSKSYNNYPMFSAHWSCRPWNAETIAIKPKRHCLLIVWLNLVTPSNINNRRDVMDGHQIIQFSITKPQYIPCLEVPSVAVYLILYKDQSLVHSQGNRTQHCCSRNLSHSIWSKKYARYSERNSTTWWLLWNGIKDCKLAVQKEEKRTIRGSIQCHVQYPKISEG